VFLQLNENCPFFHWKKQLVGNWKIQKISKFVFSILSFVVKNDVFSSFFFSIFFSNKNMMNLIYWYCWGIHSNGIIIVSDEYKWIEAQIWFFTQNMWSTCFITEKTQWWINYYFKEIYISFERESKNISIKLMM
jgi:hypothetical protein